MNATLVMHATTKRFLEVSGKAPKRTDPRRQQWAKCGPCWIHWTSEESRATRFESSEAAKRSLYEAGIPSDSVWFESH